MRCRKRQKGGKIEQKHSLQYAFYRHIFRLQLQRVNEINVKLNKEDKGEGGGAELVVRASDSEARVRVSLLTRFTMFCP